MMKALAILSLALLGVASTGCSGAWEARRAALNAPTADVGSTWTGNTTEEDKPYPVTLTLDQTGTDVTGMIRIGGRQNVSGRVRGTVRGEVLQLSLTTAAHAGGELWCSRTT